MRRFSKLAKFLSKSAVTESLASKDIISLAAGQPEHEAPEILLKELRKVVSQKHKGYTNPQGLIEFRQVVVEKLKKENKIQANPNNIIATNGSQEGFLLTVLTLFRPGDEVLLIEPAFFGYEPDLMVANVKIKKVYLSMEENFMPTYEKLSKAISKKTKAIVINTPNNPAGVAYRKKVLEEIADLAVEHDLLIIADEAYEKFVYNGKHVSIASLNGMQERTITLHSFSKTLAVPAFRLGYIVADEEFVKKARNVMLALTVCASPYYQLAVARVLLKLKKYYSKVLKEYKAKRKLIVSMLNKLEFDFVKPTGAFYIFANIANFGMSSEEFVDYVKKKAKVIFVPGKEFDKHYDEFIRISYGAKKEKIEKAMQRIANAFG